MARAQAYSKSGRLADAMKDINRALKINPDALNAVILKGRILLNKKEPFAAVKILSKVIEAKPDCGICLYWRGVAYKKMKKHRKAYFDFNRACRLGTQKGCEKVRDMNIAQKPFAKEPKKNIIVCGIKVPRRKP